MKNAILFSLVVLAACASAKPIDPPGQVPPGKGQTPGESAPASPGSAWTTQGGPSSPGSPSMGTVHTADAGPH